GGGRNAVAAARLIKLYPDYFTYHSKLDSKGVMAGLSGSSDIFVLTSSTDTSGLVYVAAMLQGLPILSTEDEGIDGFYSESVGEKVQRPTVQEITQKLSWMIENLNRYSVPTDELKRNHSWAEIAKRYMSVYKDSL